MTKIFKFNLGYLCSFCFMHQRVYKLEDFFSLELNFIFLESVLVLSNYFNFKSLMDIVVNDNLKSHLFRFNVFYNFLNFFENSRMFIRVNILENSFLSSLNKFFDSSVWLERENWDMFGIFFKNHKDLRRILTDYGFSGFPLKKEYPLVGFSEVFYDYEYKGILYRDIELMQDFRRFNFKISW